MNSNNDNSFTTEDAQMNRSVDNDNKPNNHLSDEECHSENNPATDNKYTPNQLKVINESKSSRDLFVIMPSAGGKSLCCQESAAQNEGVTIVFLPLLALIFNQTDAMNEKSADSAVSITGHDDSDDFESKIDNLKSKTCTIKAVFITPEKWMYNQEKFDKVFKYLKDNNRLARFVIDEAQSISEFGTSYRQDYYQLAQLRVDFPEIPFSVLTATANKKMRLEIESNLNLRQPVLVTESVRRSNLKLEVRLMKNEELFGQIMYLLMNDFKDKVGIIYCLFCEDCSKLKNMLDKNNILSKVYHGKIEKEERLDALKWSLGENLQVIVTTVAYSMGINKPDANFVIHYSIPRSIVEYCGEIGQAGRKGEPAHCILYYNDDGIKYYKKKIQNSQNLQNKIECLEYVQKYCETRDQCRWVQLQNYFDEEKPEACTGDPATVCDNCLGAKGLSQN